MARHHSIWISARHRILNEVQETLQAACELPQTSYTITPEIFCIDNDLNIQTVSEWDIINSFQNTMTQIIYGSSAEIFAVVAANFDPSKAAAVEKMGKKIKDNLKKSGVPRIIISSHTPTNSDIKLRLCEIERVLDSPTLALSGTLENHTPLNHLPSSSADPGRPKSAITRCQYAAHLCSSHDITINSIYISMELVDLSLLHMHRLVESKL
ncbi:hypothetical protein E1B28_001557 [Marasmius oreades]|uniref:Uncharacterized protein n=1 Tax=Marasmius oreades TaxID=181124 RepID=A0A9P7V407_9AGAR|nr:uncharacterized protein E1B28_001557 [Marasmius oreades]KAG7099742.1 hypothetical protein E1B28_001557 [Marasmius oreades]